MTTKKASTNPRKRILILSVLAIVLAASTWIGFFLASFDLNDYRNQVQTQLSSHLSLPVELGELRYQFHNTNLALSLTGLHIGNAESILEIMVPEILVNLRWQGLLNRRFEFKKISLIHPKLNFRLQPHELSSTAIPRGTTPLLIDQALIYQTKIEELELIAGVLTLALPQKNGEKRFIEFADLDGSMEDVGLERTSQIFLKGHFRAPGQSQHSLWDLQGNMTPTLDPQAGFISDLNLNLTAKELELTALKALLAPQHDELSVAGQSWLQLHIEGSPAAAIEFQAELNSDNLAITPGHGYTQPVQMNQLLASGRLHLRGAPPRISDLQLKSDRSLLSGELHWSPAGQATGTTLFLTDSSLPLQQLKAWLPDQPEMSATIRNGLQDQGLLQIKTAQLGFTTAGATGQTGRWHLEQVQAELQDGAWRPSQGPLTEIKRLQLKLADNQWQIDCNDGRLGSTPFTLDGGIQIDAQGEPHVSLNFHGEISPPELFSDWQVTPPPFSLSGKVPFTGHIEGPTEQLKLDLLIKLSELNLSNNSSLEIKPDVDDKLVLQGSLSPKEFGIDHAALQWSLIKGHFSGTLPWGALDQSRLEALITIADLAALGKSSPPLSKLGLQGQAEVDIRQSGNPFETFPQLTITLREAAIRTGNSVADLSRINGRIQVSSSGLQANNLLVHLGQSPLTVQAKLKNFAEPRLELDVKAPSIRADDLIFHSDKAILRDISGHLELDRNQLTLDQVGVRLDGGTQATVSGAIGFNSPVAVNLDITSEFANISEVIGLWTDTSGSDNQERLQQSENPGSKPPRAKVVIKAEVSRGELYGMQFQNAKGTILPSRERLVIHPLDFSVGAGFCNAQVLTEFNGKGNTLLRISGHAEDVDALEVYRELLHQKNIIRGKLHGDFYIQGLVGSQYLPSSYGNFSIQVHDGVLHQFPVLSKVFSLLNVSQLFALRLPDMATEGMPFDRLHANFQLQNGILKSEDLLIQSEAMNQSYNGQINLINKELDMTMAIHPLGTVDKIVSHIPIAGWLLTGEDKAFLTAHFSVKGLAGNPSVSSVPIDTLSDTTLGLLKRTLGLPFKLIEDPQILWGGDASDNAGE